MRVFPPAFFAYLAVMVAANILYVVFSIVALVRAYRGSFYYFPVFGRIAFARYYGPNAVIYDRPPEQNKPPEGF